MPLFNPPFPKVTEVWSSTATDITTTSTSFVLATGMTVTPEAGDYLVIFSADVSHTVNNGEVRVAFFVGGVQSTNTERFMRQQDTGLLAVAPNYRTGISMQKILTVNGSQALEVRWRIQGAGTGTMSASRAIHLIKVA